MRALIGILFSAAALCADQFPVNDVMILGDIEYGKSSDPLDCPAAPKYCALVFNGNGGDAVQAVIEDGASKAMVAIANGTLNEIARGEAKVNATLPHKAEDLVTYYVIFRAADGKAGRFSVRLNKLARN